MLTMRSSTLRCSDVRVGSRMWEPTDVISTVSSHSHARSRGGHMHPGHAHHDKHAPTQTLC